PARAPPDRAAPLRLSRGTAPGTGTARRRPGRAADTLSPATRRPPSPPSSRRPHTRDRPAARPTTAATGQPTGAPPAERSSPHDPSPRRLPPASPARTRPRTATGLPG